MYQVTGIRQRRWAGEDEKPSGMAYQAALEAIRRSGIAAKDIDAVIVATTTPDVAMPSTAAILQDRLNLQTIPAFDLNAACSGWLYAVSVAQGLILSGTAHNVLTVGVDMQSRLLDKSDRSAYFLFGDGAGAAIISVGRQRAPHPPGGPRRRHPRPAHGPPRRAGLRHPQRRRQHRPLDSHRRARPVPLRHRELHRTSSAGRSQERLDRRARPAGSFPTRPTAASSKRPPSAAAWASTASTSTSSTWATPPAPAFPWRWSRSKNGLKPGDKLVLCSVGAGMTTAAMSVEW